jgi:predicted heme/steroid binding protein
MGRKSVDQVALKRFRYIAGFSLLLIASLWFFPSHPTAREKYAAQTDKDCETCHKTPGVGPDLTPYGQAFRRGGHQYPIPAEAFKVLSRFKRIVRFFIGYFHIAAGVIWFGTIFYVHVFISPQALTRGLPKSELILGWVCATITGITGFLLTTARLSALSQLSMTKFGIILSAKIILYLLMVGIALFTTIVIRKKLKREIGQQETKEATEGIFTHTELLSFNGTGQKPTYIAVGGDVYDLSGSPTWKEGRHMGQHFAGRDLTDDLSAAPHGPEVLEKFKRVGNLWKGSAEISPRVSATRKTFIYLANSALVISFLILLCVALWRWG